MKRRDPLVLMYHGFTDGPLGDPDPDALHVSADSLRRQLELLRRRGFRFLDLDGYTAGTHSGGDMKKRCLITIDDGYRSVLDVALPIFEEFAVKPVVFISVGCVGASSAALGASPDRPLLDADGIRTLVSHGWSIGAHGHEHRSLVGAGVERLHGDVAGAKEAIESVVGRSCSSFAYPFGDFDDAAVLAVARGGFTTGFAVHREGGALARSRVDVNATDTPLTFRLKLFPHYRRWWRAAGRLRGLRPLIRTLGGGRHRNAVTSAEPINGRNRS